MTTQELILYTARNLFNSIGTAKASTNHIAAEAGISPGNLYYYYKDKAHIVREIYEQMIQAWETTYELAESQRASLDGLKQFITDNFELLWQYRFFNREMVVLLNADPILAERHAAISQARFERQRLILQHAVVEGVLRFPQYEVQLDEVLTMAWIVANYYLVHLEAMRQQVEKADFQSGAELVLKVLSPYMQS